MKLGTAYLRTSRLDKAQIQLEEAARLDPENAAIHFQLGKLYKQMHSMERARKEFARAEEIQSRATATPKTKQ
jgi:Tfp pilus assembly protein PilF